MRPHTSPDVYLTLGSTSDTNLSVYLTLRTTSYTYLTLRTISDAYQVYRYVSTPLVPHTEIGTSYPTPKMSPSIPSSYIRRASVVGHDAPVVETSLPQPLAHIYVLNPLVEENRRQCSKVMVDTAKKQPLCTSGAAHRTRASHSRSRSPRATAGCDHV